VQGYEKLPEAFVEVTDFEGDWKRVKEEVKGIYRTDEREELATARVHVVVSDRSVRKIGSQASSLCSNLVKFTAPFIEEVGEDAFEGGVLSPPRALQSRYSI